MEMLPWSLVVWSLALPATVVIRTRAPAQHQHRELQRFVDSVVDDVVSGAKSTGLNTLRDGGYRVRDPSCQKPKKPINIC
jgi:hypothetical protein